MLTSNWWAKLNFWVWKQSSEMASEVGVGFAGSWESGALVYRRDYSKWWVRAVRQTLQRLFLTRWLFPHMHLAWQLVLKNRQIDGWLAGKRPALSIRVKHGPISSPVTDYILEKVNDNLGILEHIINWKTKGQIWDSVFQSEIAPTTDHN